MSPLVSDPAFFLAARGRPVGVMTSVAKTDSPLIAVIAGWVAGLRNARPVNWLRDRFSEVAAADVHLVVLSPERRG